jgi:hypothetical protein
VHRVYRLRHTYLLDKGIADVEEIVKDILAGVLLAV